MFKELDPIIHSQLRLAIMTVLMEVGEADFNELKEKTRATSGNLSVQIQKLKDAGYMEVHKDFRNNFPNTRCRISETGRARFALYLESLGTYLKRVQS